MTDFNDRRLEPDASGGSSGPSRALIGFLVVAGLFALFFLQNGGDVKVQFLMFEKTTTVRISIIVAVLFGILLDRLFSMFWRHRKAKKRARKG